MALKPGLSPRISTRLSLTPGLRQGLSLLQIPTGDLLAEISRQALENPLVVVHEPSAYRAVGSTTRAAPDIAETETLAQSLQRQLSMMPLEEQVRRLAQFLTGDLTEDGYLDSDAEALARALEIGLPEVEAAIAALQSCTPPGVGARTLAECLALQLIDKGYSVAEAELACAHLKLLISADWKAAERATGWPRPRLKEITRVIRTLSPRPGAGFAEPALPLIPDLTVELGPDGQLKLFLNDAAQPNVEIDGDLAGQMRATPELYRTYRAQADALISALAFRGKTLLRVAEALVARQSRFFAQHDGSREMQPLTRAELAQALNLHPSTVGRTVAHKALAFDGVVYPLSHFLCTALPSEDGSNISVFEVQRRLRRIVEAEAPGDALSDAEIAEALQSTGVDIARRTVAKYRGCMNIPPSFERNRRHPARQTLPKGAPRSHP